MQLLAIPRNSLDFGNVQAGKFLGVQLAPRIDISRYNSVVVAVKVYDATIGGAAKFEVLAFADASTDWALLTATSSPLATVTIDANTSGNTVLLDTVDATSLPAMISIWVQGTQDGNPQSLQAEIEVEVIIREQ